MPARAGRIFGQVLMSYVPAIKSAVAPSQPMGIGLRLSGEAAATVRQPEALAAFRDQLSALGAYVFTINAFPFGPFHGVRVKEDVYLPDWRDRERARIHGEQCCRACRNPSRRP